MGPDEDAFTAVATALERSFPRGSRDRPVGELRVAGPVPGAADWGLRALVDGIDGPPKIARFSSVREALSDPAELDSRADVLVVAFGSASDHARPVALAVRGGPAGSRTIAASEIEAEFSANGVISGSLEIDPRHGERRAEPRLDVVSEGAYIPRPRYVESVPSRWRFWAEVCPTCAVTTFPMRAVCRGCGRSAGLTTVALPLEGGEIVAITEIGKGGQPTEFDGVVEAMGSYRVALIELVPGVRATLMISDDPEGILRIGSRVRTVLRRLYPMEGEWRYGRKAVPPDPSGD